LGGERIESTAKGEFWLTSRTEGKRSPSKRNESATGKPGKGTTGGSLDGKEA